jgi:hypothetical protein
VFKSTQPFAAPVTYQVVPAGPLPLIKAILDELEVGATIDALVPYTKGEFPFGEPAAGRVLIASRLQERPLPIYEIAGWAGPDGCAGAVWDPGREIE